MVKAFELRPVPEAWTCEVDCGSEEAWKGYYEYRSKYHEVYQKKKKQEDKEQKEQERKAKKAKLEKDDDYDEDILSNENNNNYESDGDDDENNGVMETWKISLEELCKEVLPKGATWKWSYSLHTPELNWEDGEEIRSGGFESHVWSPYAIPRAMHLEHRRHYRCRLSSIEFYVVWNYRLLDFENLHQPTFQLLCSDEFEDEELRLDVIDESDLSRNNLDIFRMHLFGTDRIEHAKESCCDNYNFMHLLFGTMTTFGSDFDTPITSPKINGWVWTTRDKDIHKQMVKEGVVEDGDEAYGISISWLGHRIRTITERLRPVDKYYHHPRRRDALGYQPSGYGDDSDEYESGDDPNFFW